MIRILGYLFTLVLFLSCSEQVDDRSGRVQLKFDRPTPTNLSIVDVNHPINSKDFGAPPPLSIDDIDCFGVMITYPDAAFSPNSCTDENGEIISTPQNLFGLAAVDGILEGDIFIGDQRRLQVVGFGSTFGNCPSLINGAEFDEFDEQLSNPLIIGETTVDIEPGLQEVNIDVSFISRIQIEDCTGPLFNFGEGKPFEPMDLPGLVDVMGTGPGSFQSKFLYDETADNITLRLDDNVAFGGTSTHLGNPALLMWSYSITEALVRLNGVFENSASGTFDDFSDTAPYFIGAENDGSTGANFGNFKLGEIIVYGRKLTTEEYLLVEEYLDEKWGNITPAAMGVKSELNPSSKR